MFFHPMSSLRVLPATALALVLVLAGCSRDMPEEPATVETPAAAPADG